MSHGTDPELRLVANDLKDLPIEARKRLTDYLKTKDDEIQRLKVENDEMKAVKRSIGDMHLQTKAFFEASMGRIEEICAQARVEERERIINVLTERGRYPEAIVVIRTLGGF